jgi:putative ABC transport system substrate-binding protein
MCIFSERARRLIGVLLITVVLVLSACGSGSKDQNKNTKVYHVGILSGADTFTSAIDGFKAQMVEDGYTEGKNITYDLQAANADPNQMARISQKFVADKVDLIFTTTNNAALAARAATAGTNVPVVFTFVIAPVQTGAVDDIAHPGGNLTGVLNPLDLFIGKRIEFLLKIVPTATRIWVPYDPTYPTSTIIRDALVNAAPTLGVELIETQIATPQDVATALAGYEQAGAPPFDAIIIFPELTVQQAESWDAILAYANQHKLPILANTPPQVEAGALFGYFSDNVATGKQAAHLARQILNGTPAGDLPVETAEQFLTINLKASETLGLNVSDDLLRQANTVIR